MPPAFITCASTPTVAAGAKILDAPAEYGYTSGYYAVFFADPDGLKLEVCHAPAAFQGVPG